MNVNQIFQQVGEHLENGDRDAAIKGCEAIARRMIEGGPNPVWATCPPASMLYGDLSMKGQFDNMAAKETDD